MPDDGQAPRIIDISLVIASDMPVWPGDAPVEVTRVSAIAEGDDANVSRLTLGSHTGTHMDPPVHFLAGGAAADQIELEELVGPCAVVDATDVDGMIDATVVQRVPEGTLRVLFRTRNSAMWHAHPAPETDAPVALVPEAARALVARGVRLVGIDGLSIEAAGAEGHPVHRALLEAGVVIVEGLDLSAVSVGIYTLVCLPLRIRDGDGAPARAILIRRGALVAEGA